MSTSGLPLYVVDAFAERPFAGNPAAVCLLESWPADEWLAAVAAEMNLSETAFLVGSGSSFKLRWFTPRVEVDLCGHATLASAFVLWHAERAPRDKPIEFATRSGTLVAVRRGETIELDFPLEVPREAKEPEGLGAALGARPRYVGKGRFDYLIELESDVALRALAPDFRRLAAVDCRGVIVTAVSADPAYDFVSRFFAPSAGIDEDPVTGSAHCTLAGYWRERLGKDQFKAYQASPRGGVVGIRIDGQRVKLSGSAVLVTAGNLLPPA